MDLNHLVNQNQSIKIVPSVEDHLHDIGLNVELDESALIWFQQLKCTWKTWKKSTALENHIHGYFQSIPEPFRITLLFIVKCKDSKDCKPKTLPYFLLETLQNWSKSSNVSAEEPLKLPAFHIGIQQRNAQFLTLLVRTYHIFSIKEEIIPIVKEMIKNDNSKQASQVVIAMELFDDIPVEDLLFPLILQEKSQMIIEYLVKCPSQVKPFLEFLDNLLDKNFCLRDYVQKYIEENHISCVKFKVHYKPLGKLVARLCSNFNIPIESCKNLSKNRTTGGLRYMIHQKYVEHNVSSSVWDDLVKDSLRQNAGSAQEFIDLLIDYDPQEALKWAVYLNIPDNELPLPLKDLSLQDTTDNNSEENWDKPLDLNQKHYKCSLPEENIIMIDSGEKFFDLLNSQLVGTSVMGIDCEWKPSFGAAQSQVALIQIATISNVYLIDSYVLNSPNYLSFWQSFQKDILDNAEIIKVGFGLEQDLKEIKCTITGLSNIKVIGEGLLDVGLLWNSLINAGLCLPSGADANGNSLSSLVHSCFGSPLEKSEQCSNWEIRPLRKTQIEYAALDAHVLIELYHYLEKLCFEQRINFDEIANDVMLEKKKKVPRKVKVGERIQPSFNSPEPKLVKDVKFLVDPKISQITSYLRYCGIDTAIISSTQQWHDTINLATSEDRFILLSKIKYTPNVKYPQSSILDIGIGSLKEQLQKVLNHFEIKVNQEDILSHCIICNEKHLNRLSSIEVANLCKSVSLGCSSTTKSKCFNNDDDDDYDEYGNFLSDSDADEDLYQATPSLPQKLPIYTSKGIPIDIDDMYSLLEKKKPAIICEDCGKLFWEGDKLFRLVQELVTNITKVPMKW